MVAIFVILTFAAMLVIDHLLLRQPLVLADENLAAETPRPRLRPSVVAGFEVPENVSFHPGHTWALAETPEMVRVGVDDFAAKVAGKVDRVSIPSRGQWIRQGQKIISMYRDGRELKLVSPIEGTVIDVNENVIRDPETAAKSPYGEGWLLKVHSPDARTNFKNLLNGTLARRWMDDAASKLRTFMPAPAGAVAHEGGVAVEDVQTHIADADWDNAARELFLSA